MKRFLKRILALSLCVLMFSGASPLCLFIFSANAKTIGEYARGDLVTFGRYPQTKVTDSAKVETLNNRSSTWYSYGYYTGTGKYSDGNMAPSAYMEYTDVVYGGQKYRGVRFSQYRPYYTGLTSSAANTFQDENGYDQPGGAYWFQWESLQWRVLDPVAGLVLCETIIDSQPFNNYVLNSGKDTYGYNAYWGDAGKKHYANNYAESSLRQWLNNDFYNMAFSSSQQDIIASTALDNRAYSTSYSAYDSASTTDKVFLLSFGDMTNTAYGFAADKLANDPARQAQGSDYAKCQGLYADASNGYSRWWLRSAGYYSDLACSIEYDGWVSDYYYGTSNTNFGIRPAFVVKAGRNLTAKTQATAIRIVKMPAKTTYTYLIDTSIDLTGMQLEVTYSDGSKKTIKETSSFKVSGYSPEPRGEKTVTVEYEGLQTEFKVTVKYAWWQWIIIIFLFGWLWY